MSARTALAVALRRAQWDLDQAAFRAGGGDLTPDECAELAEDLRELSGALHHYGRCQQTFTIDAER